MNEIDFLLNYLHIITMFQQPLRHARYLPVEQDAQRWGVHVIDYGFTAVSPGSPYPPGAHPAPYNFRWKEGRILDEFQVVYITHGRGWFESKTTGKVRVEAGHLFFLFPSVWHRYRPLKTTGWDEHWIGFDGVYARELMAGFFKPEAALMRVGLDEELLRMFRSIGDIEREAGYGYLQRMAARTVEVLARVRHLAGCRSKENRKITQKMAQARCMLYDRVGTGADLTGLARQLGMSYSAFRAAFIRETGIPPGRYHLEIRLNKVKELLRGPARIGEIADQLGFSSVYYLSRLFKGKTGLSPSAWRRRHDSIPPEALSKSGGSS